VEGERDREEGAPDGRGPRDRRLEVVAPEGVQEGERQHKHEALADEARGETEQDGEAPRAVELDREDGRGHEGQAQRIRHPVLILEPTGGALSQGHEGEDEGGDLRRETPGAQEQERAREEDDQGDLRERVERLVHGEAPGHQPARERGRRHPEGVGRILGLLRIRGHVDVVAVVCLHHLARPVDEAELRRHVTRVCGHEQGGESEGDAGVACHGIHVRASL
jgi:hypothetical protein